MTFKGCIGQPTVTWYSAAGIAWVDCAATGALQVLGVAQRAGAEAAGAASSAADTVVASAAVDGGIDAAVWCSCRPSRGKRVCGGMYYSLKQCNAADACPDACKDRWEPAKIHAPRVG